MCGRYRLNKEQRHDIWQRLGIHADYQDELSLVDIVEARPTNTLPIVRQIDDKRGIANMRWGFIEQWAIAKAKTGDGPPIINATCEKVPTSAAFKGPFLNGQRCIVPTSLFYEWPGKVKTAIGHETDGLLPMAGLYKTCRNRAGEAVQCFTIVTCPPSPFMQNIHNRMPVILHDETINDWLSPDTPAEDLHRLLVPYAGNLRSWAA